MLKTPGHLGAFDALFETYPDAVVVQTHRDPTDVMASVSSLECKLRGAGTDAIDPHATGAEQVRLWSRLLSRAMRWRSTTRRSSSTSTRRSSPRDRPRSAGSGAPESSCSDPGPRARRSTPA